MIAPPILPNETDRLENLKDYHILDTLPEKDFDDITMLASEICDSPISLVSLVDSERQWFKSNHGLSVRETPREYSFCAHAIAHPTEMLIVPDARNDARFSRNPLVHNYPNVQFYAGIPLVSPKGYALGSLCVIDNKPRDLNPLQRKALTALSNQVMTQLELRRRNIQMNQMYADLEANFQDIEQFSYVAAHDIKSPLNNIRGLINLILDENENTLNADSREYLGHVRDSSEQLVELVDGILEYSRATQISSAHIVETDLHELLEDIVHLLRKPKNIDFVYELEVAKVTTSRIALKQILLNLIGNSIKYLDRPDGRIVVHASESGYYYFFSVSDNGSGIPSDSLGNIFDLFKAIKLRQNSSTGVGLAIVKKLVQKLEGTVEVTSNAETGTTFEFKIKK